MFVSVCLGWIAGGEVGMGNGDEGMGMGMGDGEMGMARWNDGTMGDGKMGRMARVKMAR